MTALSKLVGAPVKPWPKFTDKYPVKVKVLKPPKVSCSRLPKTFWKRVITYRVEPQLCV